MNHLEITSVVKLGLMCSVWFLSYGFICFNKMPLFCLPNISKPHREGETHFSQFVTEFIIFFHALTQIEIF